MLNTFYKNIGSHLPFSSFSIKSYIVCDFIDFLHTSNHLGSSLEADFKSLFEVGHREMENSFGPILVV